METKVLIRQLIQTFRVCGLAIIVSCNTTKIEPPAPSSGVSPDPSVGLEPSHISLPISYDLAAQKERLESAVPLGKPFSEDKMVVWQNPIGDVGMCWEWKRHALKFNFIGNQFELGTTASYRAEVYQRTKKPWPFKGHIWVYAVGCGEPDQMKRIQLGVRSTFQFKPDYRLESKTIITNVSPVERCKVGIINYDVTDIVIEKVSNVLIEKIPEIDNQLNQQLNFKPQAQIAWDALQQPIKLAPNTYLLIRPKRLSASALDCRGTVLSTSVGLTAQPELLVGKLPPATTDRLPPLQQVPASNSFHVVIRGKIGYDVASSMLNKELAGKQFLIKNGYYINIESLRLYGAGTKAIIELAFQSGKVNGRIKAKGKLYIAGIPSYNAVNQTLVFEDLAYTVETRSIILKAAVWLADKRIVELLTSKAVFPVGPQINSAKDKLQLALNRDINPKISLSGNVTGLTPLGIAITKNDLQAVVVTDGNAQISIR